MIIKKNSGTFEIRIDNKEVVKTFNEELARQLHKSLVEADAAIFEEHPFIPGELRRVG